MRGRALLILLLLVLSLAAGTAVAQPAAPPAPPPPAPLPRVEVFGGFTVAVPRLETTLTTSYSPALRFFQTKASTAGQTLQMAGENGAGVEFGAAFFFTEAVGIQVLYGADSFDVGGSNEPYTAHLEYDSRQPPNYTPIPVVIDHEQPWPDTFGELRQRHFSVNLAGRGRLGPRVTAQLSGGLSYFRMEGLVAPVAFSVYHLGGHSVLFPEHYELEVALEPGTAFGLNVGGTLDVELARGVALTADFRYFKGGTITAPVAVEQILNRDEIGLLDEIETIQEELHPPAVELKPTRVRLFGGLKVRF